MDIFDKWSQQSKHYNKNDNAKYIRSLKTSSNGLTRKTLFKMLKEDDITYFKQICEGQKRTIEQQAEFIDYDDDLKLDNIEEVKDINTNYLYKENEDEHNILTYDNFINNDKIIIQSCTGTGKTTATATHLQTNVSENHD